VISVKIKKNKKDETVESYSSQSARSIGHPSVLTGAEGSSSFYFLFELPLRFLWGRI
jgi:hypothetical protein